MNNILPQSRESKTEVNVVSKYDEQYERCNVWSTDYVSLRDGNQEVLQVHQVNDSKLIKLRKALSPLKFI
ncbi:hypothetical protein M405DRAFT_562741 [Rhizopogon salebrosus TDB-379]|nr:hypothetical protein M405DRAFT_562741 [Rhizopogon salebrosus TDB-379]